LTNSSKITQLNSNLPGAIKNDDWRGAMWKIMAFACYAALNGIARYLSGGAQSSLAEPLPVSVIVFFQDLFALIFILPWLLGNKASLIKIALPDRLGLNLSRVVLSAAAVITWYLALRYLPQTDAVALSVVGPIIGVICAKIFLKERLGYLRSSIILISFIAACWVCKPMAALIINQDNSWGLLFVLLSSLFFALAKILTRKLASTGESKYNLTAYLLIFIVPVSFVPALMFWQMPTMAHWPLLMVAGALTAAAIYCVTTALSYAQVSFLAPFDLARFVLNSVVGYLVFMELPASWAVWLVMAFIVFSVVSYRTKSKKLL
jgi:drug/metabolite transporter (DMT)-like permease